MTRMIFVAIYASVILVGIASLANAMSSISINVSPNARIDRIVNDAR